MTPLMNIIDQRCICYTAFIKPTLLSPIGDTLFRIKVK